MIPLAGGWIKLYKKIVKIRRKNLKHNYNDDVFFVCVVYELSYI